MKTLADLIRARAGDRHTALLFEEQSWSHQEVVAACAQRAAYILARKTEGPLHVGVLLDNVPEFPFWLGACALAGATVVGINPTRKGADLRRDIVHTDCQFLITEDRYRQALAGLDLGIAADRIHSIESESYRRALAPYEGAPLPEVEVRAEDVFCLLFTSGTSGAPKACICSQGRMVFRATMLAEGQGLTAKDVNYIAMPLFHGNSLVIGFIPPFITGGAMALRRKFSASAFLPDVRRYGATFFNYVGKPLAYILATPEKDDDADNPLKSIVGNEATDRDIEDFARRFGCVISDGYGSTEGGVTIMRSPDMPAGSLGTAFTDGVKVLDPETGEECPRALFNRERQLVNANAAIGELVNTEGASTFEGYWKNQEATRERIRDDIFWSGDLAYRDQDGFFYFAGRSDEWMRVDGENIATAQVEQVLIRHPDVVVASVYAVPDPVVGDQVMAALQLREGADFNPTTFADFLDQQDDFGTKWTPRLVRISDPLPLTPTLKVLKRQLRQERWRSDDPVWWSKNKHAPYRLMSREDVGALEQAIADRGKLP